MLGFKVWPRSLGVDECSVIESNASVGRTSPVPGGRTSTYPAGRRGDPVDGGVRRRVDRRHGRGSACRSGTPPASGPARAAARRHPEPAVPRVAGASTMVELAIDQRRPRPPNRGRRGAGGGVPRHASRRQRVHGDRDPAGRSFAAHGDARAERDAAAPSVRLPPGRHPRPRPGARRELDHHAGGNGGVRRARRRRVLTPHPEPDAGDRRWSSRPAWRDGQHGHGDPAHRRRGHGPGEDAGPSGEAGRAPSPTAPRPPSRRAWPAPGRDGGRG